MSQIVVTCRKLSWHLSQNCRDIFLPVPFPPSPFGFRRNMKALKMSNHTIPTIIRTRDLDGLDFSESAAPKRGRSERGRSQKHANDYFACSPENVVNLFFRVCLGILHWKMAGIFGENFLVSVFPRNGARKSSKNSGKIRRKIGVKPGQKFEKFGKLSFCKFSDLTNVALGNLQKYIRKFLLYKFWRIFAGIFLEGFFWAPSPTEMRRKTRRENPRKNPAAQK